MAIKLLLEAVLLRFQGRQCRQIEYWDFYQELLSQVFQLNWNQVRFRWDIGH